MSELDAGQNSPPPIDSGVPALQGRRKAADGPRKTAACMACRKLKIKCHMPTSSAPCTRCKRRGLACSVHPSLHMLLGDDAEWKQVVTRKILWIEGVVNGLNPMLGDNARVHGDGVPTSIQDPEHQENRENKEHQEHQQPPIQSDNSVQVVPLHVPSGTTHDDITMDVHSGPATIPSFSVNGSDGGRDGSSTAAERGQAFHRGDIIADGIVTELQATAFFEDYAGRLDHYVYCILGPSATFSGIRSSSPTLLAAICTVAALHSNRLGHLYEPCYRRFANLAANLALAESANLDDIRALCIGAFWLHRISWNLSCLTVRIATQKHLHRAFRTALRGDPFHFAQARLYFLVYVCDHQFSIAYGRPPLTQDGEEITRAQDLLSLPQATEDDARLVSQVELWSITSRVLGSFGFDVERPPSSAVLSRLRRFAIEYDTWCADWNDRFRRNVHVANYPRKGVKLHVNFAKLYLCSHAFRGPAPGSEQRVDAEEAEQQQQPNSILDYSSDLEDMATAAIHAAQSILDTMVADTEIQAHLNGLPVYFHTMIAFATVFLFKMATGKHHPHVVRIDIGRAMERLSNVARILNTVTADMSTRHLLASVATAVETLSNTNTNKKSRSCGPAAADAVHDESMDVDRSADHAAGNAATPMAQPPWRDHPSFAMDAADMTSLNWGLGPDFDWTTYDFLAPDGPFFQADEQLQDPGYDQG